MSVPRNSRKKTKLVGSEDDRLNYFVLDSSLNRCTYVGFCRLGWTQRMGKMDLSHVFYSANNLILDDAEVQLAIKMAWQSMNHRTILISWPMFATYYGFCLPPTRCRLSGRCTYYSSIRKWRAENKCLARWYGGCRCRIEKVILKWSNFIGWYLFIPILIERFILIIYLNYSIILII